MENSLTASAALATDITRSSSKQTYFTFRLFVDREYIDDAFRGYAYFRWVDDILDSDTGSKLGKIKFLRRQKGLLRASPGMVKAKETVAEYAAQAREELANLPEGPGRQALATLADYTANRHG